MSPQTQIDQVKAAMAEVNRLFNEDVVGKRNFAALDNVYTANAHILPPGGPMVSGREAIKQFWMGMVQAVNAKSAELFSVEVMPAGEEVVEIGRAVLTVDPGQGGTVQMEGKYVVYWRQEAGQWKWHVDIWNMNA
jgi:ketosteroid isomerase-like protein